MRLNRIGPNCKYLPASEIKPLLFDTQQNDECESKIESPKDSQIPETLDSVKANEDICTIKGDENENKSQEKPNLSVEKISTEDLQVTFNEIEISFRQLNQTRMIDCH